MVETATRCKWRGYPATGGVGVRVWRNDRGWRVGESHPRARLSAQIVAEIRDLREHQGLPYKQIIWQFRQRNVSLTYNVVRKICNYVVRVLG